MLLVPIIYKYYKKYLLDDEITYVAIYIENYISIYTKKIQAVLLSNRQSILDAKIITWIDKYFSKLGRTKNIKGNQLKTLFPLLKR